MSIIVVHKNYWLNQDIDQLSCWCFCGVFVNQKLLFLWCFQHSLPAVPASSVADYETDQSSIVIDSVFEKKIQFSEAPVQFIGSLEEQLLFT